MKGDVRRECPDPEQGLVVVVGFMGLCGIVLWAMESAGLSSAAGDVGFWRGLGLLGGLSALAVWAGLSRSRKATDLGSRRAAWEWVLIGAIVLILLGNSGFIFEGLRLLSGSPGFP